MDCEGLSSREPLVDLPDCGESVRLETELQLYIASNFYPVLLEVYIVVE